MANLCPKCAECPKAHSIVSSSITNSQPEGDYPPHFWGSRKRGFLVNFLRATLGYRIETRTFTQDGKSKTANLAETIGRCPLDHFPLKWIKKLGKVEPMDMLATARENRIKALEALENKRTGSLRSKRPADFTTTHIVQFRSTRFGSPSPLMLS